MDKDVRIYVITHKQTKVLSKEDIYSLLEVGAYSKEKFTEFTDNTGDNISNKNSTYCELTGMYWIWKNTNHDITGICHYRRYFVTRLGNIAKLALGINTGFLKKERIENDLSKYDMIINKAPRYNKITLREEYKREHYLRDLEVTEEVVKELYPSYSQAFEDVLDDTLFHFGNSLICRKDIFDEYCKWLFDILFEVERRIDISNYDNYQKRVIGFLSERLLKAWIVKNNLKYKEYSLIKTDDPCSIIWWFQQKHRKGAH